MQIADVVYLGVLFLMLYSSILWFIVFFKNRKKLKVYIRKYDTPSITFLVPAYNEEKNIGKCLDSLLNLNYGTRPKIVVIDDGSTDNTSEIVKSYEDKGVILLSKPNEGKKSKALNYAIENMGIDTELFACMDADSYVDPNYLKRIVKYLEHADAVTPAMKVADPQTIYQKVQWVEYCFSIFLRKMFSIFDCQYVLPGPGSVYRTVMLKRIGNFDESNLTEDMELAFRMHDQGFRIENCIDAYVYTDTPETFGALLKQRIRWYRGYMHNVKKYSHMVFNPEYGNLGFFLIPINFAWVFILFFLFFYPVYTWVRQAVAFISSWAAINYSFIVPEFKVGFFYLDFYVFFWAMFWVINIATIYISIKTSGENIEVVKRKGHYVGFILMYPIMLLTFWLASILYEVLRIKEKWYK